MLFYLMMIHPQEFVVNVLQAIFNKLEQANWDA